MQRVAYQTVDSLFHENALLGNAAMGSVGKQIVLAYDPQQTLAAVSDKMPVAGTDIDNRKSSLSADSLIVLKQALSDYIGSPKDHIIIY